MHGCACHTPSTSLLSHATSLHSRLRVPLFVPDACAPLSTGQVLPALSAHLSSSRSLTPLLTRICCPLSAPPRPSARVCRSTGWHRSSWVIPALTARLLLSCKRSVHADHCKSSVGRHVCSDARPRRSHAAWRGSAVGATFIIVEHVSRCHTGTGIDRLGPSA